MTDKKIAEFAENINEVKVVIPHAEKGTLNSYERRHRRHENGDKKHLGGKYKRSERSHGSHSFYKPENEGIRVEKKIAELMGIAKEEVTKLIMTERVKVNNIIVKDLSLKVTFDDEIHVNNRLIPNKRIPLKVYIFNKPKGYIVTNSDPQGRPTIFDIIPTKLGKLITVGRLDFNSEGLMLLTNNGDFARMMELPATGVQREYRVRVFGDYNIQDLQKLKDGIEIDGIKYGSIFIIEEKEHNTDSANKWLRVTLYEGKNREIRKVMEHFGLQVNRLIRLSYGKYNLGTLPSGCVMEVKPIANPSGRARDREYQNKRTNFGDKKPSKFAGKDKFDKFAGKKKFNFDGKKDRSFGDPGKKRYHKDNPSAK